jgi:hypothetical protein
MTCALLHFLYYPLSAIRYMLYAIFWAKRAGIQKAKTEILKKFSPFLTLYFTTTYIFSVSSETSVANVFFDQTRSFAPL